MVDLKLLEGVKADLGEARAMLIDKAIAEIKELRKRDGMLSALEAGGVDNWQWYDDSLEEWRKEQGEEEG